MTKFHQIISLMLIINFLCFDFQENLKGKIDHRSSIYVEFCNYKTMNCIHLREFDHQPSSIIEFQYFSNHSFFCGCNRL